MLNHNNNNNAKKFSGFTTLNNLDRQMLHSLGTKQLTIYHYQFDGCILGKCFWQ